MIYFTFSNGETTCAHVGEKAPLSGPWPGTKILEVQADGDELCHALEILGRLGSPKRVHKFYGESAMEILQNWND